MDNIKKSISTFDQSSVDEKDIIKVIIAKIWFKRKFILIITGAFIVLGIFVAFTRPVTYTANCTVVPQTGQKSGSGLGGLASMMGVNINSPMSGETLSPYVYPQIINSVPFCKEIMETPIVVEKSNGEPITLYDYYTDNQYTGTNVLGVIKKYTVGLPGVLISLLQSSDSESSSIVTDTITGKMLIITKKEQKIIEQIQNNIQFKSNDKDGYIIFGYSFSEQQPTAIIAQNIYATLEKYVKNYKSQKQQDNLEFVEKSYERVRKDFLDKQNELASFQDSNRDLTSATARAAERRISSEYEVAYTVYTELARQLEQAKISVKESTPVLTIIDPIVVPNRKDGTSKLFIIIGFVILGLAFSVGWIFLKPFLHELVSDINGKEIED